MAGYSRVPIQLEAGVVSRTDANLVDGGTGRTPTFWRGQSLVVNFAVFDPRGQCVDLANVDSLVLNLQPIQNSGTPTISKASGTITPTITRTAWLAGSAQQAYFNFTNADLLLDLGDSSWAPYWLNIVGTLNNGLQIIYLAGWATVAEPGTPF